jgi:hypothetical protein
MKIYLDTSQLDKCLSMLHGYKQDVVKKQKDIKSYWKQQQSLDSFIEECSLISEADLIFLHLMEYPLDIHQQPTYVWFHYEPLPEEIQELQTNSCIIGWKCVSSLDNPPEVSWKTLLERKTLEKPNKLFLPLVKPITDQEGEDVVTICSKTKQDETKQDETKLDLYSCHIGFPEPDCGLLIEKQKVSSGIFETLTRNRLSKHQLPQRPNFEWKEFLGSGFSLHNGIPNPNQSLLRTTYSHQKDKCAQGMPPFHSWLYSPEQALYLEVPHSFDVAECAWVSIVLSRKHWEWISATLPKLYLSRQRPCYLYYFKDVFDIRDNIRDNIRDKTLGDKTIKQNYLDFINYQELSHLLPPSSPETLVTLTAIYHTPAPSIYYFDPVMTPLSKLDFHTVPETSVFFHRTQFYEESYLTQDWLPQYLTYTQQEKMVDVDQHLFFFTRKKNWYGLQVALWLYQHVSRHEENTASQLLILGMESIYQNYQISKKTEMRVLTIQDLSLGFASHQLLSTTWSNVHAVSYPKHIKNIFQKQVPFQWKSDLGCLVALSSEAENNFS